MCDLFILCSSRKYLYPPHGRSLKILSGLGGGGGYQKPKVLKESIEVNWNFKRGGEGGSIQRNLP